MRVGVLATAVVLGACALAGCAGEDASPSPVSAGPPVSPSESVVASLSEAQPLPPGKSDVALTGGAAYLSPDGFVPALVLVPGSEGWVSTHRGPDAFDLGLPAAGTDAPLVVVAFVVPPEDTAADGVAAVRQRAEAAGAETADRPDTLGDLAVGGLTITGGDGEVVRSRDGTLALDATPGGELEVWPAGEGSDPMLIVVYAPDASRWDEALAAADRLASASQVVE